MNVRALGIVAEVTEVESGIRASDAHIVTLRLQVELGRELKSDASVEYTSVNEMG